MTEENEENIPLNTFSFQILGKIEALDGREAFSVRKKNQLCAVVVLVIFPLYVITCVCRFVVSLDVWVPKCVCQSLKGDFLLPIQQTTFFPTSSFAKVSFSSLVSLSRRKSVTATYTRTFPSFASRSESDRKGVRVMTGESKREMERKSHNAFGGINGIDIVLNVVKTLVYTIPTFVSAKIFKGRRRRGGFFNPTTMYKPFSTHTPGKWFERIT